MFKMLKNVQGGGKSPVKSKDYHFSAIFLCLMLFISLTVFVSTVSVNAKNPPAKQHRNSGKSSKQAKQAKQAKPATSSEPKVKMRAAVVNKRSMATGTAKRAGNNAKRNGTNVANTRKANKSRKLRGGGNTTDTASANDTANVNNTEELSPEQLSKIAESDRKWAKLISLHYSGACPVEKALGRKIDEDGDELFYTGREPFNGENFCDDRYGYNVADLYKWNKNDAEKYPKGSLDDSDEIFYFKCKDGYVAKNNSEGIRICESVCPLNVALEKSESYEDKYVSSTNGLICNVPSNATARAVKSGENRRNDLDDKDAVIIECNANRYSAVLDGYTSGVHYQCLSCPSGYVSVAGAKGVSECREACKDGEVTAEDGSCISCDANASVSDNSCVCKDGYYGVGYGTDGCLACPEGYICSGGQKKSKYVRDESQETTTSSNEQQTCPAGSKPSADGTTCECEDSSHMFDATSNSCVERICGANEVKMSDGTCKALSSLVSSDFSRLFTARSGSSHCPSGDLEPGVYLVTLEGGKGGPSGSNGKDKDGKTEKNVPGGNGAKLQYVFKLEKTATYELCAGENGYGPYVADSPNEGGGGGGGSWLNINSSAFSGDVYFVAGGGGGASADYTGNDGGGGGGGGGIGAGGMAGEGAERKWGGNGGMSGKYPGGTYTKYERCDDNANKLCGDHLPGITAGLNESNPLLHGDGAKTSGGGAGGGNGGDGGDGQSWYNIGCAKGALANIDSISVIDLNGKVTKQNQQYGGKGGVACQATHHRQGYDGSSSHSSNVNFSTLCGGINNNSGACAELYQLR